MDALDRRRSAAFGCELGDELVDVGLGDLRDESRSEGGLEVLLPLLGIEGLCRRTKAGLDDELGVELGERHAAAGRIERLSLNLPALELLEELIRVGAPRETGLHD